MTLKIDVATLGPSVHGSATRATEFEQIGVHGIRAFENAHDVYLPFAAAAAVSHDPSGELLAELVAAVRTAPS